MFTAKAEHYRKNVREAHGINAHQATLTTYSGEKRPAVLISRRGTIYGVLPVDDALRLANEIADAIAAHRQTNCTTSPTTAAESE